MAVKIKGDIAMQQGDLVAARAYYEESIPMLREGEDLYAVPIVTGLLGGIDLVKGDFASARQRFADSSLLYRSDANEIYYYLGRNYEGVAALFQGDFETAGDLLRECLPHFRKDTQQNLGVFVVCLAGLAYLASQQMDPLRAGRLLGAVEAIVASQKNEFERRPQYIQNAYWRLVEKARNGCDQDAWKEGYRMSVDQAIDYALRI